MTIRQKYIENKNFYGLVYKLQAQLVKHGVFFNLLFVLPRQRKFLKYLFTFNFLQHTLLVTQEYLKVIISNF